MFTLAILIGIYSYLILGIGLLAILYRQAILLLTLIYILVLIYFFKNKITGSFRKLKLLPVNIRKYKFESFLILLLIIQALVNLVGALGPELGFDALWYHLTLPKLYIQNHAVVHISGSLLYYSDMPKLTEMLYTASLAFNNEVLAKVVHFSFGILTSIALYLLSKKLFDKKLSLIAVVIFYSNLVVGWQSITAYIDLARTFFELMALWGFINYWEKKEKKWLIESAVMLGLAISTKLLAFGSLIIFSMLVLYSHLVIRRSILELGRKIIKGILVYWYTGILIATPWLVFSYVNTGNPVYPFFTNTYPVSLNFNLLNPLNFIKDMWIFFTSLSDPISPLYIIFLPFAIMYFKRLSSLLKMVSIYSLFAIVLWYVTPRTGGGRFILPYLPAFSIVAAGTISAVQDNRYLYKLSLTLVIIVIFLSISYRGIANSKYMSVILGKESKSHFLSSHLNFSFGDFYDTDGYFKKNIASKDTVLLYGFHNLYYINFPFIDSSWVKKGDMFNYIATQNSDIPKRFSNWELIYHNSKTHVNLYSLGGIQWAY